MTRAQRYANHKGGRKRDKDGNELPAAHDPEKAESAQIFRAVWEEAKQDPEYLRVSNYCICACGGFKLDTLSACLLVCSALSLSSIIRRFFKSACECRQRPST